MDKVSRIARRLSGRLSGDQMQAAMEAENALGDAVGALELAQDKLKEYLTVEGDPIPNESEVKQVMRTVVNVQHLVKSLKNKVSEYWMRP